MTLRSDLQQVAKDALGQREGSVVVIEPATGAVKAMWSYPTYDPNLVANPDFEAARDVLTVLQASPGDPLLANAYQQRYMPGSTFKVLTTGIGLESGVIDLSTTFPDERAWVPPQTDDPIENFQGTLCGGDLTEVFTRSCNIPFAKTALDIGAERMVQGVADWGVGEPIPIDLPRPAASTFGDTADLAQNLPLLAIRGFGQNDDQMVPLHMAMVAATVANGGQMMVPYVVDQTLDHDGAVLSQTQPEVWKTPISPATADILDRPDDQCRRDGHGELLHRPRRRRPRRRQDRDGPAQRPRRARAVARLDHRLRPGRQPAVRGGRDAQGHDRGDLRRHRRPAGRPHRQDRARRRPRRGHLMGPRVTDARTTDDPPAR